jgi:hypothetical protein
MLKVQVDVPKEELEKAADAEVEGFDRWWQEHLTNDPIRPLEKALLKTFLFYLTRAHESSDSTPQPPENNRHGA